MLLNNHNSIIKCEHNYLSFEEYLSKYLLKFWYKMFGSMCSGNTGKLEVGHHQEVEFCVVVTAQVKGPESQLSRLSSLV